MSVRESPKLCPILACGGTCNGDLMLWHSRVSVVAKKHAHQRTLRGEPELPGNADSRFCCIGNVPEDLFVFRTRQQGGDQRQNFLRRGANDRAEVVRTRTVSQHAVGSHRVLLGSKQDTTALSSENLKKP